MKTKIKLNVGKILIALMMYFVFMGTAGAESVTWIGLLILLGIITYIIIWVYKNSKYYKW